MAWEIINPQKSDAYTYAVNTETNEHIRCFSPELTQRIVAFLNAKPLAYVAGEYVELDALKPDTPENTCDLYATLTEAEAQLAEYPHHDLRGMFILPLK